MSVLSIQLFICLLLISGLTAALYNPAVSFSKIRTERSESSGLRKCYLPDTSSTKFSWDLCSNFDNCTAVPPYTLVDDSSLLFVNCKDGFSRELDNNMYVINCDNGIWQPDNIFCRPIRYCQPLTSTSVEAKCHKDGIVVDCLKEVRAGTTAKFDCKFGYKNEEKNFKDLEISCLITGEWDSSIPQCYHECGKTLSKAIRTGDSTSIFDHPWNAVTFRRSDLKADRMLCSGTLVSPSVVITAGHCFYNNLGDKMKNHYTADSVYVALGLNNNPKYDSTAQIIDVESVNISPLFEGANLRYFADLAVLKLKKSAILSDAVMPACIDFDKQFLPNSSTVGTAVAFIPGEYSNKSTDSLIKAVAPFVSYEDCYTELRHMGEEKFITKDKFCAFNKDRNETTGVRSGFSGVGFISEFDGKHYLLGVLSTLIKNTITVVTDLKYIYHAQFIKDLLK